ncbi:DUF1320 domain-containing protein [Rufibacter ruber]|uniref:DUF1320 domain-containing protein n=1 Tax=Rufibacter ruber TaxID=1783499 RepID=UPI0008309C91|nr:DUF1320 domain-containing protein [Rufibacter ruber]
MYFLTPSDFDLIIKQESISQITQSDPTILENAVDVAIAEIQSYLKQRFDVNAIFTQPTATRNEQIVMYACDIAVFHLMSRVNPRAVSEARIARYDNAIKWLNMVRKGELIPDLPLIQTEETATTFFYGGNKPFRYGL